jgi:excisionase family DNA binding protein
MENAKPLLETCHLLTSIDIYSHIYILTGMDELLTLPQVAKLLGLAERTIYVWSQQGKIPAFKLGTAWRYRSDEIDAWVETQRTAESKSALAESRKFGFEKRKENKARLEAMIDACEAFIKRTVELSDRTAFALEQFEEEFEEEILTKALKRLTKSKEFEIKEVPGLNNEKVKALLKKG